MKTIAKISVVIGVLITFVFAYKTYVQMSKVDDLEHKIELLNLEIKILKENR